MLGPCGKHNCKRRPWQVNGGELPPHVLPFCAAGGAAAAVVAIAAFLLQRASQRLEEDPPVEMPESAAKWRERRAAAVAAAEWAIPSGIGVAVGMYVAAEWTLPRVIGCLAEQARRTLPWHSPPAGALRVLSRGCMALSLSAIAAAHGWLLVKSELNVRGMACLVRASSWMSWRSILRVDGPAGARCRSGCA